MITIDNPVLEREIAWAISNSWISTERYITSAVRYFREIKKDNFLSDVIDTKINWKSFNCIEDLMSDLKS